VVETWWWSSSNPASHLLDKYRERRWDMTKWDRLLAALDQVFGFQDRKKSSVKKRRQGFDEKTNEHVFIIEYRVMKGEHSDPKQRKEKGIERRNNKYKVGKLLQDIHTQVQLAGSPGVLTTGGDSPDHNPPG